MAGYTLVLYSNGSKVASNTTVLSGTIPADSTYVLVNTNAVAGMIAKANVTNNSTISFNGDDAIAILYNNTIVDVFGIIGEDPGTYWVMNGTDSAKDMTFIRKPTIRKGSTNWANSSLTEWLSLPKDTFYDLKKHTMNACAPIAKSSITFVKTADTATENIGTKSFQLKISSPNPTVQSSVQVEIIAGGTAGAADYTYSTQTVIFPAGSSTSQTVNISILEDIQIEAMESIILKIRNPLNAAGIGADSTMTLYIQDNDTLKASFTTPSTTYIESNNAQLIGVKLNALSPNPTKVKLNAPTGTASNGNDYSIVLDSLTFSSNDTSTRYFSILLKEDIVIESTETILLDFTATNNAISAGQSFTANIQDNDTLKAIFTQTSASFQESAGTVQIGLKLTAFSPNATSVSANIIGGTASSVTDFTPGTVVANFAANDTATKFFSATIVDDTLIEGNENLLLGLIANNGAITTGQQFTGTIIDNDFAPIIQFNSISSNISEGNAVHSFQVKLNKPNASPTSVNITAVGGTANGSDYSLTTTTVNFAANDSTPKNVNLNIVNDIQVEGNETIQFKFSNPTNNAIIGADSMHTVTINDNDTLKAIFSKTSSSFSENSGSVQVGVKLNAFSSNATTINATIAGGTASGTDYTMTNSSVVFAANDTATKFFTLNIVDDALLESDETIVFNLTGNNGAITIGQNHDLSIKDNESNQFYFANTAITKSENSGSSNYAINMASAILTASSVDVSISGLGNATSGVDYNFTNQTVNFPANSSSQNISLNILNDIIVEGNETIQLKLSNPTGGIIIGSDSILIITIQDNDTLKAQFGAVSNSINENSITHKVPVKLTAFYNAPTSVNIGVFASGTNTAILNTDYNFASTSVLIPANDTSTYFIDVNPIEDIRIEITEMATFEISSVSNGGIPSANKYALNIMDNDTLKVRFVSPSANFGEAAGNAQIGVKLTAFSPNPTTVNGIFNAGTATNNIDYTSTNSTLNFSANDTSTQYFSANIVNDALVESNETFTITMTANNGGLTAGQLFTATIIDNDLTIIPKIKFAQVSSNTSENNATHSFAVSLNNPNNNSTTVGVSVIGGSASGLDYTLNTTTLVFNANDSADKFVNLNISNDMIAEGIETITFKLSIPSNGAVLIADSIHTVNIQDNDTLKISFTTLSGQVNESVGTAKIAVKISHMSPNASTVNMALTSGTINNLDHTFTSQVITWAANDTATKLINIPIANDVLDESNETMVFTLSNPTNGAILGTANHTLTIIDNDTTIIPNSISNQIENPIHLYPNPLMRSDILHIASEEAINRISIYSEIGQLIQTIQASERMVRVDMSLCAKGIFLVEITTNSGVQYKKIVRE
ncbi:MAG: T9SS type A sorting domain-containing protein [Bacteroidetes bacterium]|nr:T9SS type A sorting domain-containing protein [Bacteroidota bacterium]